MANQPLLSYRMAMSCPSWDWASGTSNEEVITAIQKKALEVGYRSIDTAAAYKNEEGVGKP